MSDFPALAKEIVPDTRRGLFTEFVVMVCTPTRDLTSCLYPPTWAITIQNVLTSVLPSVHRESIKSVNVGQNNRLPQAH